MRWILALITVLFFAACGESSSDTTPAPEPAPEEQVAEEGAGGARAAAAYPNEACARVVVVAWSGALAAPDEINRTEEEARTFAESIRTRVEGGEDIAEIARQDSDASSSGPRGGMLGSYTREDWPSIHEPIRDAVFELEIDGLSDVLPRALRLRGSRSAAPSRRSTRATSSCAHARRPERG